MSKQRQRDSEIPYESDEHWRHWRDRWSIPDDVVYLNHGSFGPTPSEVKECHVAWQRRLASQPMEFFIRQMEPAWFDARRRLARFVDTDEQNLIFVENSTSAMNIVAFSFPLGESDEVVLTDHEYGAVLRIWQRACRKANAPEPRIAKLPIPMVSADQVVASIFSEVNDRTRLLVVSHIVSPTGIVLPIRQICDEALRRGIAVCVDGPHAPAQVPLSLDELPCDFYTASLHKWVSAPIGAGFLFAAAKWQEQIQPPLLSWGRLSFEKSNAWWEEFLWLGTRDPSAYFASSRAIDLLDEVGLDNFRQRTHALACYARHRLVDVLGSTPPVPDSPDWYGSMTSIPLPAGDPRRLQRALWEDYRIEIPVIDHLDRRSIRVSCHLYNDHREIDLLVEALAKLLQSE